MEDLILPPLPLLSSLLPSLRSQKLNMSINPAFDANASATPSSIISPHGGHGTLSHPLAHTQKKDFNISLGFSGKLVHSSDYLTIWLGSYI